MAITCCKCGPADGQKQSCWPLQSIHSGSDTGSVVGRLCLRPCLCTSQTARNLNLLGIRSPFRSASPPRSRRLGFCHTGMSPAASQLLRMYGGHQLECTYCKLRCCGGQHCKASNDLQAIVLLDHLKLCTPNAWGCHGSQETKHLATGL